MNEDLRQAIPFEEFDYQALMGALADYARPRDKVTDLLATGVVIRVKKGLYIFGEKWRRKPYSREILANLLYGPSCACRVLPAKSCVEKPYTAFTAPIN